MPITTTEEGQAQSSDTIGHANMPPTSGLLQLPAPSSPWFLRQKLTWSLLSYFPGATMTLPA